MRGDGCAAAIPGLASPPSEKNRSFSKEGAALLTGDPIFRPARQAFHDSGEPRDRTVITQIRRPYVGRSPGDCLSPRYTSSRFYTPR